MGTEASVKTEARLLLIDTCGEVASVVIATGERVIACETLVRQRASVEIVGAVERLLLAASWTMAGLDGIGVVRGPGSFTGVRTGLAVAKGLSEASSVPLVAVSRLDVLAMVAGTEAEFAVLDAGRGEVYVRDASGREFLCADAALVELAEGKIVAITEVGVEARLGPVATTLVPLDAGAALPLFLETLRDGVGDAALLDAYYLRDESSIYARPIADGDGR